MPNDNTATPLPAPDAGANPSSNPLSIVPAPSPGSQASPLNRGQQEQLSTASEICTVAKKADYAPALATRGIDEAFITALVTDIDSAGDKGLSAVGADGARKVATQDEATAAAELVQGLQTIQATARLEHLPDNPGHLDPYFVGEKLDQSRPLLEGYSKGILKKANEDRPGGLDTAFLSDVQAKRESYVATKAAQSAESGKGKLNRAQRNALVKSITTRRKKIQYAADSLWVPGQPASAQARAEFKLPANRPYSY